MSADAREVGAELAQMLRMAPVCLPLLSLQYKTIEPQRRRERKEKVFWQFCHMGLAVLAKMAGFRRCARVKLLEWWGAMSDAKIVIKVL